MSAVDRLHDDWRLLASSPESAEALCALVARGVEVPDGCASLHDLVGFMRARRGTPAAALVSAMLREVDAHPMVPYCLVVALAPGLFAVAARLRWGDGGEWADGDDFLADLLATTYEVVVEWAGSERPYAALDVLGAVRLRTRRRLLRERDSRLSHVELDERLHPADHGESDLERATRALIEHREDARSLDVDAAVAVLYSNAVLSYSIEELAAATGRDRQTLYRRRRLAREGVLA